MRTDIIRIKLQHLVLLAIIAAAFAYAYYDNELMAFFTYRIKYAVTTSCFVIACLFALYYFKRYKDYRELWSEAEEKTSKAERKRYRVEEELENLKKELKKQSKPKKPTAAEQEKAKQFLEMITQRNQAQAIPMQPTKPQTK